MKHEYSGNAKSYDDAKLRALTAILTTMGIEITDDSGKLSVKHNGILVATLEVDKMPAEGDVSLIAPANMWRLGDYVYMMLEDEEYMFSISDILDLPDVAQR